MSKLVELRGQPWLVRLDSYRFYVRPAMDNPLVDREEMSCLEFKHNDGPASELAELLFRELPGKVVPDALSVMSCVECPVHGMRRATNITDFGKGHCDLCERESKAVTP